MNWLDSTSARGASSCKVVTIICSPRPSLPMQIPSRASSHPFAPTPVAQTSATRGYQIPQAVIVLLRKISRSRDHNDFPRIRHTCPFTVCFWPEPACHPAHAVRPQARIAPEPISITTLWRPAHLAVSEAGAGDDYQGNGANQRSRHGLPRHHNARPGIPAPCRRLRGARAGIKKKPPPAKARANPLTAPSIQAGPHDYYNINAASPPHCQNHCCSRRIPARSAR